MFLTIQCKKCGNRSVLDVGNYSNEKIEEFLSKTPFGECPAGGWHVEMGSRNDYFIVDYDHKYDTSEEAIFYNNSLKEKKVSGE